MQFLDPLLLAREVHRETGRKVQTLIAAKSMKRKAVGFFAGLMSSSEPLLFALQHICVLRSYMAFQVPVARAADDAKPGTGRIYLSDSDPCRVLGYGTKFLSELSPKMQILLSKTINSSVAEVVEVISDTEVKIKKEFGGESGKGTARIRERLKELQAEGIQGLDWKKLPFVDQQEMYRYVYQCLKAGGCIGIFPEGASLSVYHTKFLENFFVTRRKSRPHRFAPSEGRRIPHGPRSNGKSSRSESQDCSRGSLLLPRSQVPFSGCHRVWFGHGCARRFGRHV